MEYQKEHVKVSLKTESIEYGEDCRPADPTVYQKFDQKFKNREVFDMWERIEPSGESWLGVTDGKGEITIEGDFLTYIHIGSYQDLMEIGMKIGREHPKMKDFYFVYLNSPTEVEEENLKTKIVFREE